MEANNKPNWKTIPKWVGVIRPNPRGAWYGYDALPKYTRCAILSHPVFRHDTLTTYDIAGMTQHRPEEKREPTI